MRVLNNEEYFIKVHKTMTHDSSGSLYHNGKSVAKIDIISSDKIVVHWVNKEESECFRIYNEIDSVEEYCLTEEESLLDMISAEVMFKKVKLVRNTSMIVEFDDGLIVNFKGKYSKKHADSVRANRDFGDVVSIGNEVFECYPDGFKKDVH